MLCRFNKYAHIPSSANPEPPIVIGRFDKTVDAEVAINELNSPILDPTASANTINEKPCSKNATKVIAIPAAKVLIAPVELKFSLLIMQRSAIAIFAVL